MDVDERVAPLCVYTITHSERLRYFYNLGGVGELTEGKRWVRGEALLKAARLFSMRFLVLFAPAEDTERVTHYATLDTIRLFDATSDGHSKTDYTFSALTAFRLPGLLKTSLINEATGKGIPASFDRPYLICQTPSLLIAKAKVSSPHQAHSRRLR
jgi:hypothetical protein